MADRNDEAQLAREASAGCEKAFERLVESNISILTSFARHVCTQEADAQELAQDTIVEAWRSIGKFDGRCRFSTWAIGILRNRYLKWLAKQQRRTSISMPLDLTGAIELAHEEPSHDAELSEDAAIIEHALSKLSAEHRTVIRMRFYSGASLECISTFLGCPLGTVKSRLHHGLEKLRAMKMSTNRFEQSGTK